MYALKYALVRVADIISMVIIIRAIMSWFLPPDNIIYRYLSEFTHPLDVLTNKLFGRFCIVFGMMDITPIIQLLLLRLLQYLVLRFV